MSAKITTNVLKSLRDVMKNTNYVPHILQAFIIPSCDAHQSEYIAAYDERRAFISGFTGSMGTAIVTEKKAALWTDGRYFLEASRDLDSNWILMKEGYSTTPTQGAWLNEVLPAGCKIGYDPFLISYDVWRTLSKDIEAGQLSLIPVEQNLIDIIWNDQPERPKNVVECLSLEYTGMTWQEKIALIRKEMSEKASVLVITALDEIAWLFNLRGSDISYNPVFYSYAIVTLKSIYLFIDADKLTSAVKASLFDGLNLEIFPYDSVRDVLQNVIKQNEGKIWISGNSSYALVSLIPKDRQLLKITPIQLKKAVKNAVEIEGAVKAHIKDAVALCEFFSWLEHEVPSGQITEIDAAEHLDNLRKAQENCVGLSFETITSFGPNAAIIHYKPTSETNRTITVENVYLVDSGGQYRDGTTDVTRTLHFGTPTSFHKKTYTLVLKGVISLSSAIFPKGSTGHRLDALARCHLWKEGLDYLHGTGHGVGAFLNVHEGPVGISYRVYPNDPGLEPGMILSIEPGYYEDNNFGIRIENLAVIEKANTNHNFNEKDFLCFKQLTLVPLEPKLIEPSLLTTEEIKWINDYHTNCRDVIGQVLKEKGKSNAYQWLMNATVPLG